MFTRKIAKMKKNRLLRYDFGLVCYKFLSEFALQHSKLCTTVNVGGIVKDKCEDTYLNTDGKPCETGFKQEKKHCVRMTVLME